MQIHESTGQPRRNASLPDNRTAGSRRPSLDKPTARTDPQLPEEKKKPRVRRYGAGF